MPWLRVDEKFSRGRKVKRAARVLGGRNGRARVLAVWLDAMSYCTLNLTDGFYPDEEMDFLPDAKPEEVFDAMAVGDDELGAIVERHPTGKGWVFRNYADYQPTKAEVEAKLAKDRDRKRGGFRKDSTRNPSGENAESERTRPDRTRPDQKEPRAGARRMLRMEPPAPLCDDATQTLIDKAGVKQYDGQWFKGATLVGDTLRLARPLDVEWVTVHFRERLEQAHGSPLAIALATEAVPA